MGQLNEITISTQEVAALLMVSESYISDLVTREGMPKIGKNKFNAYQCTQWRLNHLQKIFEDQKNKLRDFTNRGRLDAANAKLKELELAEKEGTLAPVKQFELALMNEAMIFKKGIESFTQTLKYDLGLNPEQQEIIEEKANRILTQFSALPPDIKAEDVKIDLK